MAFIGNTNTTQAFTPAIDYFSGTGSATAFTLSRPVASVAQVQVTIDNVAQNPSSAYTVSANTITFTSAPLSGTNNIYVYYTSPITQVIAPGQGTVTATSFVSSTGTGAGVFQTSPTITTPTISQLTSATSTALTLQSAGTTAITVDTSQNVGIGTTSPSTYGKLVSYAGDIAAIKAHGSGSYPTLVLQNATAGTTFSGRVLWKDGNGNAGWNLGQNVTVGSGYLEFNDGATNRMAILPGGTVCINATSVASGVNSTGLYVNASIGAQLTYGPMYISNENNTDNVGRATFSYKRGGTEVGFVSTTNTSTAYNTSSDYRLKENIAPMMGALANVARLKPVTYKWKSTGSDGEGFIAHELAEVCPHAVTNEKDAVDENGNPKYQAIDTSFLVATLTAAIQELKAINDTQAETINALTARIEALENR
jgi:hypothetical protein